MNWFAILWAAGWPPAWALLTYRVLRQRQWAFNWAFPAGILAVCYAAAFLWLPAAIAAAEGWTARARAVRAAEPIHS